MAETVPFASDDPEMCAATAEAQQRLPEFRRALEEDARRIIPVIGRALIKARFRTASGRADEHLWLEDIGFEDEDIVATVANEPADVPNLRLGSSVTVASADVSDWIYWVGKQTFGGFTVGRHEPSRGWNRVNESNQAMERTADRCAFTFEMTSTLRPRAKRALVRRRSSCSR